MGQCLSNDNQQHSNHTFTDVDKVNISNKQQNNNNNNNYNVTNTKHNNNAYSSNNNNNKHYINNVIVNDKHIYDTHTTQLHNTSISDIHMLNTNIYITSSDDNTAIIYNNNIKSKLYTLIGHNRGITEVCSNYNINNNDKQQYTTIYTSSRDKTVNQYKIYNNDLYNNTIHTTLQPIYTYTGHSMSISSLCINYDNTHIASGSRNYKILIHDINSNNTEPIQQLQSIDQNVITSMCYLYNSSNILCQASEDLSIRLYDTRLDSRYNNNIIYTCIGSNNIPYNIISLHDTYTLITSHNGFNNNGCELVVYDIRKNNNNNNNRVSNVLTGHSESVYGLCSVVNNNNDYIISSSKDSSICIWSYKQNTLLTSYNVLQYHNIQCVDAYNNNNNLINITGGCSNGNTVSLCYNTNDNNLYDMYSQ